MKINTPFIRLLTGKNLRKNSARELFLRVFQQKVKDSQTKSLLLLLAKKGETAEEVLGCLEALRKLEPAQRVPVKGLMDTCGTGGDRSRSINVSTLAALVIAGAGGKVAKHGNRAISSSCGSSDLAEALGINIAATKKRMLHALRKTGFGYFHAPLYHPIFSRVQPLRRSLKTKTLFNLLGPLANPFKLEAQMIGVSRRRDVLMFSEILRRIGIQNAFVFHSGDGMDEISSRAKTFVARIRRKKISRTILNPSVFGFHKAPQSAYGGGGVSKNKRIALALLRGELNGPVRDIVVLNAAAGLILAGKARNFSEGIRLAGQTLKSGKAYHVLESVKRMTRNDSQ